MRVMLIDMSDELSSISPYCSKQLPWTLNSHTGLDRYNINSQTSRSIGLNCES
jgi:hypothetical protein